MKKQINLNKVIYSIGAAALVLIAYTIYWFQTVGQYIYSH